MRPLHALSREEARGITGVVFDLDDTLLDHGALTEPAYRALFRLREARLRLIACTGRPALWAELAVRQWPVDAAIAENGAISFVREPANEGPTTRVVALDAVAAPARVERRAHLTRLAVDMLERFPECALADDNAARITDVTLDIGEHRQVAPAVVEAMRAFAESRGARTFASSVHVHLTFEPDDKASGALRLLSERFGEDATAALAKNAYIGDSANDAAAFAAFHLTFGVANVRAHLGHITVPPRYVTPSPMGAGLAELAAALADLRS